MLNLETNSIRVPNKQAPIEIKGSIQYPLITKAAPKAKPLIMTAPIPVIKSVKGLNENMKASAIKEAISGHKNKCMPRPGVTQIPVSRVFTSRAEDSEMEIPPLVVTGGPIMQKLASDACARKARRSVRSRCFSRMATKERITLSRVSCSRRILCSPSLPEARISS